MSSASSLLHDDEPSVELRDSEWRRLAFELVAIAITGWLASSVHGFSGQALTNLPVGPAEPLLPRLVLLAIYVGSGALLVLSVLAAMAIPIAYLVPPTETDGDAAVLDLDEEEFEAVTDPEAYAADEDPEAWGGTARRDDLE